MGRIPTIVHTIETHSRRTWLTLWVFSDLHIGHQDCNERRLRSDIEMIAQDKRHKPSTIHPRYWLLDDIVGAQCEDAISILSPVADKIIGFLAGNHEWMRTWRDGDNPYWRMIRALSVIGNFQTHHVALGARGFIRLRVKRNHKGVSKGASRMIDIFAFHGHSGSKTPGGDINALFKLMQYFLADLYLMGHLHVQLAKNYPMDTPRGPKDRWGAIVPSYVGGLDEGETLGLKGPVKDKPPRIDYVDAINGASRPRGALAIVIKPEPLQIAIPMGLRPKDLIGDASLQFMTG